MIAEITFLIAFLLVVIPYIIQHANDQKLISTVTHKNRGNRAERKMVLKLLKAKYSPQAIFHDLYLNHTKGNYTQIDILLATKVGIIVFEIKEYSGWIYGSGHGKYWTQVLSYGNNKYRFYNPILQNRRHVDNLKSLLNQFENIPFYSVIVFYGDCEFKTMIELPDNTFICKHYSVLSLIDDIVSNNNPAPYGNKKEIIKLLSDAVKNGEDSKVKDQHIRNVNDMLSKKVNLNGRYS